MNRIWMVAAVVLLAFVLAGPAAGTNGMDLEGYGPVAAAMGGASMAYDNGTAATMNNPATLAWTGPGVRVDLALGMLGPKVEAKLAMPGNEMTAESDATSFFMPAIGVFTKRGKLGFGLGVFGQGGMGTEYAADTWLADPSMGVNTALKAGLVNRSEVSVGRAIVPLTYDVNEKLSVGGSADFVWAGMDLQMAMGEAQFQDLANPQSQKAGTASGTLVDEFGRRYKPFGGRGINQLYHAYFDFSNDSDFTGQAFGTGFAAKLGLVYKVSPALSVGAAFQSATSLADLETDEATLSMAVNVDPGIFQGTPTGSYTDMDLPVSGKITVKEFEWPATYAIGGAYKPMDKLLLALDLKYIAWSGVMEDFKMTFTADDAATNGGFAGLAMDAVLFQEWEDQMVLAGGAAYQVIPPLTLRAGFNHGKNPVPTKYLNALFPAIVENHLTFGAGYAPCEKTRINGSLMYGFEISDTNPGNGATAPPIIPPVESTHSQLNWAIMLTRMF